MDSRSAPILSGQPFPPPARGNIRSAIHKQPGNLIRHPSHLSVSDPALVATESTMRRLLRFAFLPILLLLIPQFARAVGPRGDAFLGYSRTGTDTFYAGVGGLNGWEAALHVHLRPFVGAEADVSQYGIGSDSTMPRTTSFLFGPRVTIGAARVHLFAHGLFGGEHSSSPDGTISGNAFAFALGGGLDVPIAPFFAWRVAGDYLKAPTQYPTGGTPGRFSTGLVFRF